MEQIRGAERISNILQHLDYSVPNKIEAYPTSNEEDSEIHGGIIVAKALYKAGVRHVFTLSGGHICKYFKLKFHILHVSFQQKNHHFFHSIT